MQDVVTRACTNCGIEKSLNDFSRYHKGRYGHISQCKACKARYDKSRVLTSEKRERKRAMAKRYYQSPEGRERHRVGGRNHYIQKYHKHWEWRQAARARKAGSSGVVTWEEWRDIIRANDNKCYWCRCELHISILDLDHVQPLSQGGKHIKENVVPACANCNRRRRWEQQVRYPEIYEGVAALPSMQEVG